MPRRLQHDQLTDKVDRGRDILDAIDTRACIGRVVVRDIAQHRDAAVPGLRCSAGSESAWAILVRVDERGMGSQCCETLRRSQPARFTGTVKVRRASVIPCSSTLSAEHRFPTSDGEREAWGSTSHSPRHSLSESGSPRRSLRASPTQKDKPKPSSSSLRRRRVRKDIGHWRLKSLRARPHRGSRHRDGDRRAASYGLRRGSPSPRPSRACRRS